MSKNKKSYRKKSVKKKVKVSNRHKSMKVKRRSNRKTMRKSLKRTKRTMKRTKNMKGGAKDKTRTHTKPNLQYHPAIQKYPAERPGQLGAEGISYALKEYSDVPFSSGKNPLTHAANKRRAELLLEAMNDAEMQRELRTAPTSERSPKDADQSIEAARIEAARIEDERRGTRSPRGNRDRASDVFNRFS